MQLEAILSPFSCRRAQKALGYKVPQRYCFWGTLSTEVAWPGLRCCCRLLPATTMSASRGASSLLGSHSSCLPCPHSGTKACLPHGMPISLQPCASAPLHMPFPSPAVMSSPSHSDAIPFSFHHHPLLIPLLPLATKENSVLWPGADMLRLLCLVGKCPCLLPAHLPWATTEPALERGWKPLLMPPLIPAPLDLPTGTTGSDSPRRVAGGTWGWGRASL